MYPEEVSQVIQTSCTHYELFLLSAISSQNMQDDGKLLHILRTLHIAGHEEETEKAPHSCIQWTCCITVGRTVQYDGLLLWVMLSQEM